MGKNGGSSSSSKLPNNGNSLSNSNGISNHVDNAEVMYNVKPKPKISAQSSVNDECETESTTSTEHSNSDDFVVDNNDVHHAKVQTLSSHLVINTNSQESAKKKKKNKKIE